LFPTKFGLLFATKPLSFLSHDDIDAMDVSRGGVSFRTFDLNVKLKPPIDGKGKGKSVEFRMLPQEEMEPLKRYVAQCAFRRDAAPSASPVNPPVPNAGAAPADATNGAAIGAIAVQEDADETVQVTSSKRVRSQMPVYNDDDSDEDDDEEDESFGSGSGGSDDDSEDSYSGGSIVVSDYNSDTAGQKKDSGDESSAEEDSSDTEVVGKGGDDDEYDEDEPFKSLAMKRQKTSEE
jgi:hypothetical protein